MKQRTKTNKRRKLLAPPPAQKCSRCRRVFAVDEVYNLCDVKEHQYCIECIEQLPELFRPWKDDDDVDDLDMGKRLTVLTNRAISNERIDECWLCYTPGHRIDLIHTDSPHYHKTVSAIGDILGGETDCDLPKVLYNIIAEYIIRAVPAVDTFPHRYVGCDPFYFNEPYVTPYDHRYDYIFYNNVCHDYSRPS